MNDLTKEKCIHEKTGLEIEKFSEYYICKKCSQWVRHEGEDLIKYKKWIHEALNK